MLQSVERIFQQPFQAGSSRHSMSNPMQEFSPQLGHHSFGLAHDVHHSSHRSPVVPTTTRTAHPPATSFMHDAYSGLNGQSLGYNVHVSADKNLLLAPGLGGMAGHGLSAQGNLQPGYPPRPVETSSLSCDSELAPSAGTKTILFLTVI